MGVLAEGFFSSFVVLAVQEQVCSSMERRHSWVLLVKHWEVGVSGTFDYRKCKQDAYGGQEVSLGSLPIPKPTHLLINRIENSTTHVISSLLEVLEFLVPLEVQISTTGQQRESLTQTFLTE